MERLSRNGSGRVTRSGASGDRSFPALISSDQAARDKHRIFSWLPVKSVPLIDSHADYAGIDRVLGTVSGIHSGAPGVGGGNLRAPLMATVTFADESVNPRAEVAYQLYRAGIADALSVSFIPREFAPAPERGSGAMDIAVAELLEVSVVAVPSDPNSRVLARALSRAIKGRATRGDRIAIARAWQARVQEQKMEDLLQDDGEVGRALRAERAEQLRAGPVARTTSTLAALGYDHQVDRGEDMLGRCQEHHRALSRSLTHGTNALGDAGQELADTLEEYGGDNEPLARCLRRLGKHIDRATTHVGDATESCTSLGNTLDDMDDDDPVPDMPSPQTGPTGAE